MPAKKKTKKLKTKALGTGIASKAAEAAKKRKARMKAAMKRAGID